MFVFLAATVGSLRLSLEAEIADLLGVFFFVLETLGFGRDFFQLGFLLLV